MLAYDERHVIESFAFPLSLPIVIISLQPWRNETQQRDELPSLHLDRVALPALTPALPSSREFAARR